MEDSDAQCICVRCGEPFKGQVEGDEYVRVMTWPLWCTRCLKALKARGDLSRRVSLSVN
jgi:hypothetical protein